MNEVVSPVLTYHLGEPLCPVDGRGVILEETTPICIEWKGQELQN